MKRTWKKLALGIALALACPLTSLADVTILHTNDMHAGIDRNLGLARVAQYKKDLQQGREAVILADGGDAIQGEPVGKLSESKAIIDLMNAAGYDFAIPGNHEFDYGMKRFLELVSLMKCGYYSANFTDLRTGKNVLPAYRIFEMDGKKIALIGATTPQTLVSASPVYFKDDKGQFIYGFREDAHRTSLYDCIQQVVEVVREKGAEYVILVGHFGSNGSIPAWSAPAVIKNTKGIDAVIDGHSHEQYTRTLQNKEGKNVVLAQTGTKLETLGKLVIHDDGTLTASLISGKEEKLGEDRRVASMIKRENEAVHKELAREVGECTVDLVTHVNGERRIRNGETNLGDLEADAVREEMHADIAMVNGGGIRSSLPKGKVTYQSLLTIHPFSNMMALRQVSGQQILDALELGAAHYPEENGGFLHVSGLTYTIDATISSSVKLDDKGQFIGVQGARRVKNVMVEGKPIDPTEDYRVAGPSYIMKDGGNGMTMFDGSYLLRDADVSDLETLAHFIEKQGRTIGKGYENPEGQGCIRIIK